jgi:aspartate-semialdehyde dehydrogenase
MGKLRLAVVGAGGLVGEGVVAALAERRIELEGLHALGSERSLGQRVEHGGQELPLSPLADFDFASVDLAIFAAPASVAEVHVPRARAAGALVLDHSAAFRLDPAVPLVVPELATTLADDAGVGLIAFPSAEATALAIALAPLEAAFGLKAVRAVGYLSASSAGRSGLDSLAGECRLLLNGLPAPGGVFPSRLAFNVIPAVGALAGGESRAEREGALELVRLLSTPALPVELSLAWVSAFFGLGLAVEVRTSREAAAGEVREALAAAPGLKLARTTDDYATPAVEATGQEGVYLGRLRAPAPGVLAFWLAADNVLRGGAANSVRAVEILVRDYF